MIDLDVAIMWFQRLWGYSMCFTDHRIKFIDAHGAEQGQPTHGNVFVYIGTGRTFTFEHAFGQFGRVVRA